MVKKITPLGVKIDYKEYWEKRKKERFWCELKIDYERMRSLLSAGQFTLEDFCKALFRSEKKQEIALKIIEYLKKSEKDVFFKDMIEELGVSKSTAWQVYLSLKRAGVIQRKSKAYPLTLSTKFSEVLEDLIFWWKSYVKVR